MAWKRYSDEDCLKILRQVELNLASGTDVAQAAALRGAVTLLLAHDFRSMVAWHGRSSWS
jgi:hypothetical protein